MSRTTSDFLRLLAIVAVLLIHGSSFGEWQWVRYHSPSFEIITAMLANQLARFCVPVFILLSGFGLYLKYKKSWTTQILAFKGAGSFFADRAWRIGLPFLFLSTCILACNGKFKVLMDGLSGIAPALSILWTALTEKPAIYHFYFFTAIIQCYLFFPLLIRLPSKKSIGWMVLGFLCLIELLYSSPCAGWFAQAGWRLPHVPSSSPLYWLFWFYAGMMLAEHAVSIRKAVLSIPKSLVLGATALTFIILFGEYLFRASYLPDPGYFNHFSRWVVIPYTLAIVALFIRFDDETKSWIEQNPRRLALVNTFVGVSFPAFIWHVWILKYLNTTILAHGFFLLNSVLLIVSFTIVYLFSRFVKKPEWLRAMLGFA